MLQLASFHLLFFAFFFLHDSCSCYWYCKTLYSNVTSLFYLNNLSPVIRVKSVACYRHHRAPQLHYIYLTHFRLSLSCLSMRPGWVHFFFFPEKPRRDCDALIQATLSRAFGFLKYALDTNKVLRAMPPLIRSNCPAGFIPSVPLVIWIAAPSGHRTARP